MSKFIGKLEDVRMPIYFDRKNDKNVLFKGAAHLLERQSGLLQSFAASLMAETPGDRLKFLLIDPLGLGKNFSGLHLLGDFDKQLISTSAWSRKDDIREQLNELLGTIGSVQQGKLRAEPDRSAPDVDEYNKDAGAVAVQYCYVLIHGFPKNFDQEAIELLEQIVSSGPACGVHTLMTVAEDMTLPHGVSADNLFSAFLKFDFTPRGICSSDGPELFNGEDAWLRALSSAEVVAKAASDYGERSLEAQKVIAEYEQLRGFLLQHNDSDLWEADCTDELSVPIGPIGNGRFQELTLNSELEYCGLIVGASGSGKSNLLHVIITGICEKYSPDEVELYLIDFKDGTEFKDYASNKTPHVRVVALETEVEFGLAVLRGLLSEMSSRANFIRQTGIPPQFAELRRANDGPMPRVLFILDEFQELFKGTRQQTEEATSLLDRLLAQGRAFGIHVVLASQKLDQEYLPKQIQERLKIRIALNCAEADSARIFATDNDEARFLKNRGEAIYNDAAGAKGHNVRFQVSLLRPDERVRHLKKIRANYDIMTDGQKKPLVFEGSARPPLDKCEPLNKSLTHFQHRDGRRLDHADFWLGRPVSIEQDLEISLRRATGENLLLLSKDEGMAANLFVAILISMMAQTNFLNTRYRFFYLGDQDDSKFEVFRKLAALNGHDFELCVGRAPLEKYFARFQDPEDDFLKAETHDQRTVIFIYGLHRAQGSFPEYEAAHSTLIRVLKDGPERGLHAFIWMDTVSRFRSMLGLNLPEFRYRLSGDLSQEEFATYFDVRQQGRRLRENRALLFDQENPDDLVLFLPYSAPSEAWFGRTLSLLAGDEDDAD